MTAPAISAHGPVADAARALLDAARSGRPVGPVRDLLPDREAATGYAVQQLLTDHALASGRTVVGRKIGLTSPAVQRQLGVATPDTGMLFDDMRREPGQAIAMSHLLQPRIEAEIAFVLGADLDGDVTPETVRAATAVVLPAFEIVDSRIAGWDITLVDTVADNASSALFVLGADRVELGDRDLRAVAMRMTDGDGREVSAGTGADCLDDPVLAVVWLARTVRDLGVPLRAGETVLSGALGPMVAVSPGAVFHAELSGLGGVEARFATASQSAEGDQL